MNSLHGIKVVIDDNCVSRRWVFPTERFVEYEPKDESWCRMFGFGHEVIDYIAYEIKSGDYFKNHYLVMHPKMWEQFKHER